MAGDSYMKIDGIEGESTDKGHEKWIEILSYSHGMSQPSVASTSSGGGRTSGRVNIREFTIVKMIDKSTPTLAAYCCDGKHIPAITIELCEASGDKHKYMMFKLTDVIISSIEIGGGGGGRPTETVTYNFGKIQWEYTPLDHAGKAGPAIQAGWNLEQNVKV